MNIALAISAWISCMFGSDFEVKLEFQAPPEQVHLKAGHLQTMDGVASWLVDTGDDEPEHQLIFEWQAPNISKAVYALEGEIRYSVPGSGYLELIHNYGQNGVFFTRSMAEDGPMGLLKGESKWRRFVLPFYRNKEGRIDKIEIPPPTSLSLFLHAPKGSEIALKHVRLVNLSTHPDMSFVEGQWWTQAQSGLIFGILGSVLGILYGLMSLSCSQGKHRPFVASSLASMGILGILCLASAFAGAFLEQPGHVTWPLFILSFALLAFLVLFRPIFKAKFQASELRRMDSQDVH